MTESIRRSGAYEHPQGHGEQSAYPGQQGVPSPVNPEWPPPPAHAPHTGSTAPGTGAGQGYGALKNAVAEAVVEIVEPFRTRTTELLADPAELDRQLAIGAEHAREVAERTVRLAYERVGFLAAGPSGAAGAAG